MIDLHTHSNKSDGTFTPSELVDYATSKSLSFLALTDHDTTKGIQEAVERAQFLREHPEVPLSYPKDSRHPFGEQQKSNALEPNSNQMVPEGKERIVPEIIPGIEFSTDYNGKDVHIVALNIRYDDPEFNQHLENFLDSRDGRNKKMAEKLREVGIGISYEGMLETFPGCVLTRAHFAKYLLEYGYVRSTKEAFERYLSPGCPCYVPREKVTPRQAVEIALEAGGIPVLAHPMIYHFTNAQLEELISDLKEAGLVGIEAIYCTHNQADERYVRTVAKKYDLLISGGSDFHGAHKPGLDLATGYGKLYIPDEVWFELRNSQV